MQRGYFLLLNNMPENNEVKRKPGRTAIYLNNAERARAWRDRQRKLIAKAKQPVEPIVIERVVEKIIELSDSQENESMQVGSCFTGVTDEKILIIIKEKFGLYKAGDEKAKLMSSNAERAATTAREIIEFFSTQVDKLPESEEEFLKKSAEFFDQIKLCFQNAQQSIKARREMAKAKTDADHQKRINEIIQEVIGNDVDSINTKALAMGLLQYGSEETLLNEAMRLGVKKARFFISQEYELRAALKNNDPEKIAETIAEIRMACLDIGYTHTSKDGNKVYHAGWGDFVRYFSTVFTAEKDKN